MWGIRLDRVEAPHPGEAITIAAQAGLDCIEVALSAVPSLHDLRQLEPFAGVLSGLCLDFWVSDGFGPQMDHTPGMVGLLLQEIYHVLPNVPVVLPCLGQAAMTGQLERHLCYVLDLFHELCPDGRLILEWGCETASGLALLTDRPWVGWCYDFGNARTCCQRAGRTFLAEAWATTLVHFKYRGWGSSTTEHFPTTGQSVSWYRYHADLLRSVGFRGPIVLEIPRCAPADLPARLATARSYWSTNHVSA